MGQQRATHYRGGGGPISGFLYREDRKCQPQPFGRSLSRNLHRCRDSRTVRLVTYNDLSDCLPVLSIRPSIRSSVCLSV
jgi:hypothetical protein